MPLYSHTILDHYRRPRNYGALVGADVVHEGANPLCGDRIRFELRLQDDVVSEARFRGDACAISTAAASLLTERLRGMAVPDVERLGEGDVLAMLDAEIAPARLACARLPLRVVHDGLRAHREGTHDVDAPRPPIEQTRRAVMAAEPLDREDVELLRAAGARAGQLSPADAAPITALADRLAGPAALPAAERGTAVQRVVTRADVEAVRAAAERLGESREAERLQALAGKLAAYLPPKNGG